jgi:hypothetical protein
LNAVADDLLSRVIDYSERMDLATINLDEGLLQEAGKPCTPLSWPPMPPEEGRGIMLCGFPGGERIESESFEVNFGLFTGMGIARRVTDSQISWLIEREFQIDDSILNSLPRNFNLGGVSGGPLISWFESPNHVAHYRLSGIITEHPDYEQNDVSVERVVAIRADLISEEGRISTVASAA